MFLRWRQQIQQGLKPYWNRRNDLRVRIPEWKESARLMAWPVATGVRPCRLEGRRQVYPIMLWNRVDRIFGLLCKWNQRRLGLVCR